MKIIRGPMLESYATLLDIPVQEVIDHVNDYVNNGKDIQGAPETEKERFEQIKADIQNRIDSSITEQIRRELKAAA